MAEVKECDKKEKWQAIIKASHPNMTQTALTWHPTATVRNTSTLKLRSALSTLWFSCENQQRAILFPPASHLSDLSQSLSPFRASQLCHQQSQEFQKCLWFSYGRIIYNKIITHCHPNAHTNIPFTSTATTQFSKYSCVYRCRMTH